MSEPAAEITLHNTRTRQKERFQPLDPSNVRMYVCGPTVYDRAHIGNARPVVVFDVLFRLLRHTYGPEHVTYVRNVTDVDDKINARAAAEKRPIRELTDETLAAYHADMDALGALRPTHEPRATDYIPAMIAMIETLVARGHAYEAQGHVLFAVASFPAYGRFANRTLDDMQAGARVEVAPYKRNPLDFVLWKPSTSAEPGWPSPWGHGRPGWHIECSAMSDALLGATFDIHGGGIDLVFPHHENEIAQSMCAHPDAGFARYWLHNGFLNVEGEKMSKSLGNFFTVRDLLDKGIPGEVIRFVLLSTHYRQPMDFTERKIDDARTTLTLWEKLFRDARRAGLPIDTENEESDDEVVAALSDDLNTPLALKCLRDLATRIRLGDSEGASRFRSTLSLLGLKVEGFRNEVNRAAISRAFDAAGWTSEDDLVLRVEALLAERRRAREHRDFRRADAIRDALTTAGVLIMDRPDSETEWERGPDFDPTKLAGLLL